MRLVAALIAAGRLAGYGGADTQTSAEPTNGEGLLAMCAKYEQTVRPDGRAVIAESDVPCHYYVMGLMDGFTEYQAVMSALVEFGTRHAPSELARMETIRDGSTVPMATVRACVPNVTYAQIVRVIVKYLNDHPERLHLRGKWLAMDALTAAFPCPTSRQVPSVKGK